MSFTNGGRELHMLKFINNKMIHGGEYYNILSYS
jgi:hypothetical protein